MKKFLGFLLSFILAFAVISQATTLSLVKSADRASYTIGDTMTYTITMYTYSASAAVIWDTLPTGFAITSVTNTNLNSAGIVSGQYVSGVAAALNGGAVMNIIGYYTTTGTKVNTAKGFSVGDLVIQTSNTLSMAANTATPTITQTITISPTPSITQTITQTSIMPTSTPTKALAVSIKITPVAANKGQKMTITLQTTVSSQTCKGFRMFYYLPNAIYFNVSGFNRPPSYQSTTMVAWDYYNIPAAATPVVKIYGYDKTTGTAAVNISSSVNVRGLVSGWNSPTAVVKVYNNNTPSPTNTQTLTQTITQTITPTTAATAVATATVVNAGYAVDVTITAVPVTVLASQSGVIIQLIPQGTDITGTARTVNVWDANGNSYTAGNVFSKTYPIGTALPNPMYQGWIFPGFPQLRFGLTFSGALHMNTDFAEKIVYVK